ncbi:uncharacterized protein LOC128765344 [Synchiropus splendidus]|uniref:uncharacterized protein LOC128765344 n=1 Tax=Synchiropus splendidus TaxID=270530 RepID=UPI00237D68C5|nr:uncharacterized protein LOC128765344 [Synchiropus splendidus]
MATTTPRRMLVFKIQKRLSELRLSQLQAFASAMDDGEERETLANLTELELYDMIVDYLRGERLRDLEDEGMAQLLYLEDLQNHLLFDRDEGSRMTEEVPTHQVEKTTSTGQPAASASSAKNRDVQISTPTTDNNSHSPPHRSHLITSPVHLDEQPLKISAANGTEVPFDGWAIVELQIRSENHGHAEIQVPLLISRNGVNCAILGSNVITEILKENKEHDANF